MSTSVAPTAPATFLEFCEYIVNKKDREGDAEADIDSEVLVDFFFEYIEPFANEKDIELPDELIEYISTLYVDDSGSDDAKSDD